LDKYEGASVAEVLVVAGEQPRLLRGDVDLVGVAEGLLEEADLLAIMGEVGALAEQGEPRDLNKKGPGRARSADRRWPRPRWSTGR
jgi:hypothetical protein